MGRPKAQLDLDKIEKLASIGLTVAEIAVVYGVNKRTLERNAMEVIDAGRLRMHSSLRRKQFEVAMGGNTAMLIWMGKQHLDQTDRPMIDVNVNNFDELSDEQRIAELASIFDTARTRNSSKTDSSEAVESPPRSTKHGLQ